MSICVVFWGDVRQQYLLIFVLNATSFNGGYFWYCHINIGSALQLKQICGYRFWAKHTWTTMIFTHEILSKIYIIRACYLWSHHLHATVLKTIEKSFEKNLHKSAYWKKNLTTDKISTSVSKKKTLSFNVMFISFNTNIWNIQVWIISLLCCFVLCIGVSLPRHRRADRHTHIHEIEFQ